MPVDTQRSDYSNILPKWQRLRDCFNGRDAILKAGAKYVPNLPGLDDTANTNYRARGNFYNAVGRTVAGMNGAIFQESPKVKVPAIMEELLTDITLTNTTFETFAAETGKEVFLLGRYGILIDMPPLTAIEKRPYCVGYLAEDIINWRTERRGGDEVLTMVVLRENITIPKADDPFCNVDIVQYRVVMLKDKKCVQQLWRKNDADKGNEWAMFGDEVALMRRGEALTFVPFVFMGALHPSPDLEKPPLEDLADVNLGHWRNSVDHEHGLHLVALPTPWIAGGKGSTDGPMKVGPSVVWELEVQGSAGMLEFTGEGLKAIVAAMEEKKKQMATLGARLLEDAPTTAETASAVKLRHGGETASLKTVAQSLEQGLTIVLQICVWWQGSEAMPTDVEVSVQLNKEYLSVRATPQEIQVALTALQAGEMSFETWWNLLVTGGWARKDITAEEELKAIGERKPDVTTEPAAPPQD